MAFLLDTNVVSETIRPRPQQAVVDWIQAQSPTDLFLAAQTIGELVRGARKVKETARRERFERWIEQDLARQFEGRILPFDGAAAAVWGRLMGDGDLKGQPPAAADAQIAAVAFQHELILVTRNEKDFVRFDVQLLNPWRLNERNG
ncbi:type II toxin-antitoxin system VapC family toxin [Candidatus Rariloculus sp.]|uniref:type II toxin-antitoxin system VapC family toxin n=1 Tax=Candidatus Rariloculus sp. TaxID=3101265 RepID=UPI003D143C97